jgi:protoheme IX farnesyltransferase
MSVVTSSAKANPVTQSTNRIAWLVSRWPIYKELTKPRIVTMVLVATGVGFIAGSHMATQPLIFLATMLGTASFAGSASVMNQVMERRRDARMKRTLNRPLPSGRIDHIEATLWGLFLLALGTILLISFVNMASFGCALATWVLYLAAYTPLKPISTINTVVGAIPGALPPVIGWAGATGKIGVEAIALFLILFLWQFPHFLAIAWLYRADYRRGGYRMITLRDRTGLMTGMQALGYATVLIPVSILPVQIRMAGSVYLIAALVLSLFYWIRALEFARNRNDFTARRMLFASLWYLPLVYLFLILNPLPA